MFNFDYITKEDIKEHNPNWPEIPDRRYRILIVGRSGSKKTKELFNLLNHEPDIDKIYLYAKDPYEAKYQLLINKRESIGIKYLNDSKADRKKKKKLLANTQMILMVFIKILKNAIQIRNKKY